MTCCKMEKHIKISIGIPVYNVEKYIEKSLTSALEQDFSLPYEIIVVDDRGTDGSMGIVKRIVESHERGNIVRVIQHENNKGLGEARNTIINNAKGKYLFFLDSDDWMMENALAVLYKVAEESQSEIACGSTLQEMEATGKQSVYFQYTDAVYEHEAVGAWMIAHGIWIATTAWNKLYRIDFLRKYDIRTIHRICEDQWFSYMSWLYAKKIALLSEVTLCYNIRTASIMTSMYGKKGTDESARTCCDIINGLRKIIKEQFPNTFGAYDLYYKAIKANLNILLCSVYSEQQKRYIALQLKNAVKDVPSICSLHTTRYRFIYLCSLIFDNMFSFYRYDKWYSIMFGKPRSLIHNIPYIMNKVLFVSHEASRTGAPLVLLSLVKAAASLSTPPISLAFSS